ncbi:DUF3299 domain-containing protein [Oceanicaulis sp. MMSF_3324]|uniref:DUF3299 domain-containing protein n=1 Tax=Oceanicaulis sp. MMSF_3324 TaxID=3046702 RepID=UPI0027400CEE|nr:DUF3299 domain-containing protein [Oceanicaulis sp. MMSF_3324]
MMRTTLLSALLAFSALAGAPEAFAADRAEAQSTPEFLDLSWADLLPEGEAERIAQLQQMQAVQSGMDHFGAERMPQIQTFNTVDALDGQVVRMGGYVLPFDFTGSREISRFLLVPYVGACIHVPPPPPNQLVYVHAEEPIQIQGLWDPVYVKGVMRTDRHDNELGDTAYTLELTEIQPYES